MSSETPKKAKMLRKGQGRGKKVPKKRPFRGHLDWSTESVMVTGSTGALGLEIINKLRSGGCKCRKIIIPDGDLNDSIVVDDIIEFHNPSIIIHTNANARNIDIFIATAMKYNCKFITIGIYPGNAKIPIIEIPCSEDIAADVIREIERHVKYLMMAICIRNAK